jgi:hypothetical protein
VSAPGCVWRFNGRRVRLVPAVLRPWSFAAEPGRRRRPGRGRAWDRLFVASVAPGNIDVAVFLQATKVTGRTARQPPMSRWRTEGTRSGLWLPPTCVEQATRARTPRDPRPLCRRREQTQRLRPTPVGSVAPRNSGPPPSPLGTQATTGAGEQPHRRGQPRAGRSRRGDFRAPRRLAARRPPPGASARHRPALRASDQASTSAAAGAPLTGRPVPRHRRQPGIAG